MKKIIGIGGNLMFDAAGMFSGYPRAYVNHDYVAAGTGHLSWPANTECRSRGKLISGLQ